MSNDSGLTEREAFWLGHLRACGRGSLKAYAQSHGLDAGTLYAAKSRLKRKGIVSSASGRLVRVEPVEVRRTASAGPSYCRVHLRNGVAVELACAPEHWGELLASAAALP